MLSKKIYANNGERLDQIVFREYKSLEHFSKVIDANPGLKNKVILTENDLVILPQIEIKKNKLDKLW